MRPHRPARRGSCRRRRRRRPAPPRRWTSARCRSRWRAASRRPASPASGVITTTASRSPVTSTVRTPSIADSSGTTVVAQLARQRRLVVRAAAGGQHHAGRSSVPPAMTCGSTPCGQLGVDAVERGLHLVDRVVDVGAELVADLHDGQALAGRRGDLLQAGDALDGRSRSGLGDLRLDDLGAGAGVGRHDEGRRDLHRRQQLLLERRHGEQRRTPVIITAMRAIKPSVGETESGEQRHRRGSLLGGKT